MIELKNVNKKFGEVDILKSLDFKLQEGVSLSLQGASGVGKTTLLRIIAGLETINGGEVWIDGKLATNHEIRMHPSDRNLSFVFQFPTLWPHMRVVDNICYGLGKNPIEPSLDFATRLMKNLEIYDLRLKKPYELSGGEAKRVSIARALVTKQKYQLMDEPLAHLDKGLKKHIIDVIKTHINEYKSTLLYVTHDEETIELLDFPTVFMKSSGTLKEG